MSYLCYLSLFTYSGVQHILCCVVCIVCLRVVCPMLPAYTSKLKSDVEKVMFQNAINNYFYFSIYLTFITKTL
jgi:hypothetical protein